MKLKRLLLTTCIFLGISEIGSAQFHFGFHVNTTAANAIPSPTTDLFPEGNANFGVGFGSIFGGSFFKQHLIVDAEINLVTFNETPDIMSLQGSLGYSIRPDKPFDVTPSIGVGSIAYLNSSNGGDEFLNPAVTLSYKLKRKLRAYLKTGYGYNLSQPAEESPLHNGYTFYNITVGVSRTF